MRYLTEQRKILLAYFAEYPNVQFDIDDIQKSVDGISKSAIYRNISLLVAEGTIRRFQSETGRKFRYQYIGTPECNKHFHLKCSICGTILHMDAASSKVLTDIVGRYTDFDLDRNKTLLLGHCASCK